MRGAIRRVRGGGRPKPADRDHGHGAGARTGDATAREPRATAREPRGGTDDRRRKRRPHRSALPPAPSARTRGGGSPVRHPGPRGRRDHVGRAGAVDRDEPRIPRAGADRGYPRPAPSGAGSVPDRRGWRLRPRHHRAGRGDPVGDLTVGRGRAGPRPGLRIRAARLPERPDRAPRAGGARRGPRKRTGRIAPEDARRPEGPPLSRRLVRPGDLHLDDRAHRHGQHAVRDHGRWAGRGRRRGHASRDRTHPRARWPRAPHRAVRTA